jgi:hypothetical protein
VITLALNHYEEDDPGGAPRNQVAIEPCPDKPPPEPEEPGGSQPRLDLFHSSLLENQLKPPVSGRADRAKQILIPLGPSNGAVDHQAERFHLSFTPVIAKHHRQLRETQFPGMRSTTASFFRGLREYSLNQQIGL